jgi:hypothetical protein
MEPHLKSKYEPWSPGWMREQLRRQRCGAPPNAPVRDRRPPEGVDPPLCECRDECIVMISWNQETYGRRFWTCGAPHRLQWGSSSQDNKKEVKYVCCSIHYSNASTDILNLYRKFSVRFSRSLRNLQVAISITGLMTSRRTLIQVAQQGRRTPKNFSRVFNSSLITAPPVVTEFNV